MIPPPPPQHHTDASRPAGTAARPAPGTYVTSNRYGQSTGAAPSGGAFDFCFRPSLGAMKLAIGHGYVSSVNGDGPHAPTIDGAVLGGTKPAQLKLDPSQVNDNGESFAVLEVHPDDKGQITAQTKLEIVHSKDASPSVAPGLGRKAIAIILWNNDSPLKVLPLVHFNLQYVRVIPSSGNGAPQHFFL